MVISGISEILNSQGIIIITLPGVRCRRAGLGTWCLLRSSLAVMLSCGLAVVLLYGRTVMQVEVSNTKAFQKTFPVIGTNSYFEFIDKQSISFYVIDLSCIN